MTTPQKFVDEARNVLLDDGDSLVMNETAIELVGRIALALSKAEARGRLAGLGEQYKDDKKLDGTDYAHPAWWRGHDSGCDGIVLALNDVLDGKKKGGIFGSPSLQKLRERIENIEAEGARLENEAIINIIHEKFYSGMCEGDLLQHIRSRQRSSNE